MTPPQVCVLAFVSLVILVEITIVLRAGRLPLRDWTKAPRGCIVFAQRAAVAVAYFAEDLPEVFDWKYGPGTGLMAFAGTDRLGPTTGGRWQLDTLARMTNRKLVEVSVDGLYIPYADDMHKDVPPFYVLSFHDAVKRNGDLKWRAATGSASPAPSNG